MTERDRELVLVLTSKVKLLAFDDILRRWWPPSKSAETNARRRLAGLVDERLLVRESEVYAKPRLPLDRPVHRWKPGEPAPNFGELSWKLQSRWSGESRQVTVYLATKRAAAIFGGKAEGRIKNLSTVSHDIHLGALYLKLSKEVPSLAAGWIGEGELAESRKGLKLPDSIIHDREGRPRLVVEFGGGYPADRVEAFHDDCAERHIPYELW